MKKILYLILLLPAAQALRACPTCAAQTELIKGGSAVRQERRSDWGQTHPAYRGMGSQEVEAEGSDDYEESEDTSEEE
jgi:hypothetical protein